MNFFLLAFVFSRENRRPKTAKFKIYLSFEDCRASGVALSLGLWWCPLVQAFEASGPAGTLALVLWSGVPSFCPLSRFVLGALALKYAFIRVLRAFLAWFVVFVWVCVVLVLCVACGAFVCVNS